MSPSNPRQNSFDAQDDSDQQLEVPQMCSICHEPPINAIQLECGHIFCYSCIKSAAETTGVCALCRAEIGIEFNFQEHQILGAARVPSSENGQYWFYEGFRGWWLFDYNLNRDIERAYQEGVSELEKFVAGHMYKIDLTNFVQQRSDGEGRIRKICRASLDLPNIIGMAGLKSRDFDEILDLMKLADENRRL